MIFQSIRFCFLEDLATKSTLRILVLITIAEISAELEYLAQYSILAPQPLDLLFFVKFLIHLVVLSMDFRFSYDCRALILNIASKA